MRQKSFSRHSRHHLKQSVTFTLTSVWCSRRSHSNAFPASVTLMLRSQNLATLSSSGSNEWIEYPKYEVMSEARVLNWDDECRLSGLVMVILEELRMAFLVPSRYGSGRWFRMFQEQPYLLSIGNRVKSDWFAIMSRFTLCQAFICELYIGKGRNEDG
jgi:hypothetical protein